MGQVAINAVKKNPERKQDSDGDGGEVREVLPQEVNLSRGVNKATE